MSTIFHITTPTDWQNAQSVGVYRGDTLETEGFIHCSTIEQVLWAANKHYAGQSGLLLLCIDDAAVTAPVKYEHAPNIDANIPSEFPHIYGELNIDAVTATVDFPLSENGRFALPANLPTG